LTAYSVAFGGIISGDGDMVDLKTLLETYATRLAGTEGINFVFPWPAGAGLGTLPGIVLNYDGFDAQERPSGVRIDHRIEVEIIVAPYSDLRGAYERLLPLVLLVMARIQGDIRLGDLLPQGQVSILGGRRSEAQYGRQNYLTYVLLTCVTEIADVDYS